jgi:hypothetical protein
MQTTPYRTSSKINSGIIFPRLESWNSATETATIAADVDKKRVLCRIALCTLIDRFGACDESPMQLLAQHRLQIQEGARKLIEEQAYEEDGSVTIGLGDI